MESEGDKFEQIDSKHLEDKEALLRKIDNSKSIQAHLKEQNLDFDVQMTKMRGVIEQLIVENNSLNEKLKLVTDAGNPDQLKQLNEQVKTTFENEFQQEYFKMKDKLRTKETEIRNLKLTISLSS